MARIRPQKKDIWPSWRYSPDGEGRVFAREEDVPEGWVRKIGDTPQMQTASTEILDRDELIAQLTEMEVPIKPTWGNAHMKRIIDGDISSTW